VSALRWLALSCLLVPLAASAQAGAPLEIAGLRIEPDQLERLASDTAARTLEAVEANVAGLELAASQKERMRAIYERAALDVFTRVVETYHRSDLDEAGKQERARELVLEGQRRTSQELAQVLDPAQLARYRAWEAEQVEAFASRRFETQRARRRR
jgi:hypothetical protein